jgi:hypothetical protein
MQIIRREFLGLSGLAVAAPSIATIALAQAQAGPKLTQILRKDLEGQDQVVQRPCSASSNFPPAPPLLGTCIPALRNCCM